MVAGRSGSRTNGKEIAMGQVGFGQPDDGVIQMAYVVEDIRATINHWVT